MSHVGKGIGTIIWNKMDFLRIFHPYCQFGAEQLHPRADHIRLERKTTFFGYPLRDFL